jgi:hypothetical protein
MAGEGERKSGECDVRRAKERKFVRRGKRSISQMLPSGLLLTKLGLKNNVWNWQHGGHC